ncbi:FAD binding domain-containing protein, partial [Actinoplanes derwentensis]
MHAFTYLRADSAEAAVRALSQAGPGVRLLAGGTTLYDLMKLGVEQPATVIDIQRVPELAGIEAGPDGLVLGAASRMADVAAHPAVVRDFPALSESLSRAASPQIRSSATLGGNLLQRTRCCYFRAVPALPCHKRAPGSGCSAADGLDNGQAVLGTSAHCTAVYPGDAAIALLAFDAVIDLTGPNGERTIPLAGLHLAPGDHPDREHTLASGELILRIRVPATAAARASTYVKIRPRESYAFALASCAAALDLDTTGRIRDCRLALGGVA